MGGPGTGNIQRVKMAKDIVKAVTGGHKEPLPSAPAANNLAQAAAPQAPAMNAFTDMTPDAGPSNPVNNASPAVDPAAEKNLLDAFKETEFGKGFMREGDIIARGEDGKIKWGDTLSRTAGRQASNYVQGAGSRSRQRAAAGQEWVLRSLRNE